MTGDTIEGMIIPKIKNSSDKQIQNNIESMVEHIMNITESEDYIETCSTKDEVKSLEKQIDQMVYDLYGLTKEEIAIVEGE